MRTIMQGQPMSAGMTELQPSSQLRNGWLSQDDEVLSALVNPQGGFVRLLHQPRYRSFILTVLLVNQPLPAIVAFTVINALAALTAATNDDLG